MDKIRSNAINILANATKNIDSDESLGYANIFDEYND